MVKDALASLAKSIGGLILLPFLLCIAFIPFYLVGALLLWMGVWNNPASGSACQIYGWIPHLADCGGPQTNSARDLSIDVEITSDYCIDRYCPEPLLELSALGEYKWMIHEELGAGELGKGIRSRYYVRVEPEIQLGPLFTSVRGPYDGESYYVGLLDEFPLDAFKAIVNTVTIYDSESSARASFPKGSPLPSKWGSLIEPVGYDEARLDSGGGGVSLWVRRGPIVINLEGTYVTTALFAAEVKDAATPGVVRAMALLLARADDRAETMILTGQILLDGQPIPRAEEDSATGIIAYLSGFVGTYRIALDEFYSNPRYAIGIQGTAAMKGAEITFQLQLPPSCSPTECVAVETIPFKPGKTREVDLHFESNR